MEVNIKIDVRSLAKSIVSKLTKVNNEKETKEFSNIFEGSKDITFEDMYTPMTI